jgi:hypothetical protein
MSYQHKFVIKNSRDRMGHMRKRTLNFKAGECWELLGGCPITRNPCTLAGGSWLLLPCSSAGIIVTIRW